MNKRTKTILTTGSLALVLAGTGAGVATAQTSTTPTPPGTASSPAPTPTAKTAKHPHHKSGLRGRVEHGEFTVHTKTGDKTLDTQRGVVSAVNVGLECPAFLGQWIQSIHLMRGVSNGSR